MNISALKSGNFRLYLAGNIFAVNALWMLRVTVGWIAWDTTGSASFVGLIAFLYFAPTIMAGPLFGVLTDRVNVRHASLIVQSFVMALSGLLLALFHFDLLGPVQLIIYAAMAGFAMSANTPIRMALTPRLVERELVSSVVNFQAINFNLARMAGPAIAGWLIATQGIAVTLAVTTVSYLPFLVALTLIHVRARENDKVRPPPFVKALIEGVRHVAGTPVIRQAMIFTALSSFFIRAPLEILPVLADGVFERGATGLGILTSVAGVGALLGGFILAMGRQGKSGLFSHIPKVTALGVLAMIALGQVGNWYLAVALVGVLAMLATLIGITNQTTIQIDLEDGIRGRVMSLWSVVAIGSAAGGSAVQGGMSDLIGFDWTMLIAGALALCLLGWHLYQHKDD